MPSIQGAVLFDVCIKCDILFGSVGRRKRMCFWFDGKTMDRSRRFPVTWSWRKMLAERVSRVLSFISLLWTLVVWGLDERLFCLQGVNYLLVFAGITTVSGNCIAMILVLSSGYGAAEDIPALLITFPCFLIKRLFFRLLNMLLFFTIVFRGQRVTHRLWGGDS